MAKHLARLGWEITVVSPASELTGDEDAQRKAQENCNEFGIRLLRGWPSCKARQGPTRPAARQAQKGMRNVGRKLFEWLQIDTQATWIPSCLKSCGNIRQGQVDLVLASGPPFSAFFSARRVARRLGVPYVLDYRDPWTLGQLLIKQWRRHMRLLEQSLIRHASGMLVVSHLLKRTYERSFQCPASIEVITNGYDPAELGEVEPQVFDDCAVIYAGNFYPGYIEIGPVIESIVQANAMLGSPTPAIRLHYYGNQAGHVLQTARSKAALRYVIDHGLVSRERALSAIKGGLVSVVITSIRDDNVESVLGIITGKLFDALGSGTPVLLVAPAGSEAADIVKGASAGQTFSSRDVSSMARWLAELSSSRKQKRPSPPERYSWPLIALKLDQYLRTRVPSGS